MKKSLYLALLATVAMPLVAVGQEQSSPTTTTQSDQAQSGTTGSDQSGTTASDTEKPASDGAQADSADADSAPATDDSMASDNDNDAMSSDTEATDDDAMSSDTEATDDDAMSSDTEATDDDAMSSDTEATDDDAMSSDDDSMTSDDETMPADTATETESGDQTALAGEDAVEGPFVTVPQTGAWRASDLEGKNVEDANGEDIGDISDVLVNEKGEVIAVLVGVGGFLGIGEKDVAVSMSALEFGPGKTKGLKTEEQRNQEMAAQTPAPATGTGTAGGTTTTAPAAPAAQPAEVEKPVVGDDNLPDRIVLNVTREELDAAPSYSDVEEGDAAMEGDAMPADGEAPADMEAQPKN